MLWKIFIENFKTAIEHSVRIFPFILMTFIMFVIIAAAVMGYFKLIGLIF